MPGWLKLIGIMSAIGPVSIDLYVPGFPAIEADLHEHGVARTMASYLFGIAIGQLFCGPLSDRFGRKPPLYFGFAIYTLGAIGCSLATSMTMLIVCRVVQALGGCSAIVIGRAIVRDRCEPQDAARAFTMLMTIVSVAPILAPVAGGWIVTAVGWRATFVVQAALGFVVLTAMHFMLKESRNPEHVQPLAIMSTLRTYARMAADRAFLGYCAITACIMAAMFCYVSGAPTALTQAYGLTPEKFGWLVGLNGVAFMSASRLNLRALHRHTPDVILRRCIWAPVSFAAVLVVLNLILQPPVWAVIGLQFAFFVMCGRIMPNVTALALAGHARDAGSASALMGSLQSVGPTLSGLAVAQFNTRTLPPLFGLMTCCAGGAWLAFLYARSVQRGVANS
jgi:MFS transporter, DHA1 family, multidrug resistance protein